jgi:hypothetical protein
MPLNLPEIPEKRFEVEACQGKAQFLDHGLAARVAHRMSRTKDQRITPYACPFCGAWHVGRSVRHKKRPPPKRGPDRQRIMRRTS